MTTIDRVVRRVSRETYGVLYPFNRQKHRRIVVQLGPRDVIQFRELGRRTWYSISVDRAFSMLVKGAAGFRLCMVPGPKLKKSKKAD